jgi:peroxiredoxin Q/BCP
MAPKVAPDFYLPDQNGKSRSLKEFRGRWVVLYFYPLDNLPNCTTEACSFRDEYQIITQFGNAEIIGINHGSVESHAKFALRHHLNFPILSDAGHEVTKAYGAWRTGKPKMYDKPFGTRRNTYIINPKGKIVKEYHIVNPRHHAQEVINDLQSLQTLPNHA